MIVSYITCFIVTYNDHCTSYFNAADVTVTDPTHFTCTISNPLMTSPFNSSTSFTFKGTCELIALSSCDISHPKYFRIAVDFLTDTLNNGAVGVFTNNFKWISREDGTFFTDYEGLTNIIDEDTLHYVDSGITVQAINSSTKIMVDNGIGVTIQHIYGQCVVVYQKLVPELLEQLNLPIG